ncbi:glycosyltransferase family 2 protein [Zavarzinia compransoris]|uniref:Glycosyltransferase n=1 Tax=Zavarzinia compransoris TaxID=1264899 RepID=A0A317E3N2_9PROT|nr:glycosyltransferase family 2 protein [Zavarzinia compransoris]PWR20810.1 glycosyltransferase [Zavarzinia compransoris]TDP44354.1 glycosyltransferase involved in cell wall biosynthesis [Zavarzinia compransoris]
MAPRPFLSLVVPVRNEEEVLDAFFAALAPVAEQVAATAGPVEFIFIDDGSTDRTAALLRARAETDPRVRLVSFSRNFGKEAGLTAGLHFARGDVAVPIDVDLQDPPELIPAMIAKWRDGFDVVYGERVSRPTDTWLKRLSAERFYRLFNRISDVPIPFNAGDFRLMDRAVVEALCALPERTRFMKGLFAAMGYRQAALPYVRPERAAGTTKFRFLRLWAFALDGITSFSSIPLRVWSYVGGAIALLGLLYGGFIGLRTLVFGRDVPGFATLAVMTSVIGGLQLLSIGVLGEYVARLFVEAKQRPIFIVRELAGFDDEEAAEQARKLAGKAVIARHRPRPAPQALEP